MFLDAFTGTVFISPELRGALIRLHKWTFPQRPAVLSLAPTHLVIFEGLPSSPGVEVGRSASIVLSRFHPHGTAPIVCTSCWPATPHPCGWRSSPSPLPPQTMSLRQDSPPYLSIHCDGFFTARSFNASFIFYPRRIGAFPLRFVCPLIYSFASDKHPEPSSSLGPGTSGHISPPLSSLPVCFSRTGLYIGIWIWIFKDIVSSTNWERSTIRSDPIRYSS